MRLYFILFTLLAFLYANAIRASEKITPSLCINERVKMFNSCIERAQHLADKGAIEQCTNAVIRIFDGVK